MFQLSFLIRFIPVTAFLNALPMDLKKGFLTKGLFYSRDYSSACCSSSSSHCSVRSFSSETMKNSEYSEYISYIFDLLEKTYSPLF